MTKKSAKSTKVQGTNVQVENVDNKVQSSNLISKVWDGTQYKEVKAVSYEELVQIENSMNETYKQSTKEIKDAVSLYRKSLESAVSDLKTLYYGFEKSGKFGGLFGVDIDVNAVEVTKLSLLLKVLEDENKDVLEQQQKSNLIKISVNLRNW